MAQSGVNDEVLTIVADVYEKYHPMIFSHINSIGMKFSISITLHRDSLLCFEEWNVFHGLKSCALDFDKYNHHHACLNPFAYELFNFFMGRAYLSDSFTPYLMYFMTGISVPAIVGLSWRLDHAVEGGCEVPLFLLTLKVSATLYHHINCILIEAKTAVIGYLSPT